MNGEKKYYQIDTSIDPKIIGRSELPLTVEIKDKIFSEQSKKYTLNITEYFKDEKILYSIFPKQLKGKMCQRKKQPIDVMRVMPYHPVIEFVISEKVKIILETLKVNKSEYHVEEFSIEGSDENFYFLFIPLLQNSEYVDYEKTVYYDGLNKKYVIFGNFEKYEEEKKKNNYMAKTLYVNKKLESRDIISVQAGGPFYSERIIEAFRMENVIGYDMVNGGDSKVDLNFI